MPDETFSSKSGLYPSKPREWGKKKSTDERLAEGKVKPPTQSYEKSKSLISSEKGRIESIDQAKQNLVREVIQKVSEPPVPRIDDTSVIGNKETPSLFRKKKEKKEEQQAVYDAKEEHYTDETVEEIWKNFGKHRMAAGAGDAEKLVLGRKMDNREGNEIVIHLGSQLEMTILAKIEQELVQFLRQGLQNDLILLKKDVAEQQATQKLYTSQDKYAHMIEQNPAIKTLKKKLGLDFEY